VVRWWVVEECTRDGGEVDGGAVEVGEGRVGLIEDEGQVGSGDEDDVDGVAGAQGLGEGGEGVVLLLGATAVAQEFLVDGVDAVDFARFGANTFHVFEETIKSRFDDVAGSEYGDAAG